MRNGDSLDPVYQLRAHPAGITRAGLPAVRQVSHQLGERPSTRNWWDDGDDCLTGAFVTALILQHETEPPSHSYIESQYQRYHPDWDNRASTINLPLYWRVLREIGVWVEALHEAGDMIDNIATALAQGNVPVAWIYLQPGLVGPVWHHAVNITHYVDGYLELHDAQTGLTTWVSIQDFVAPAGEIRSSGYCYTAKMLPF